MTSSSSKIVPYYTISRNRRNFLSNFTKTILFLRSCHIKNLVSVEIDGMKKKTRKCLLLDYIVNVLRNYLEKPNKLVG